MSTAASPAPASPPAARRPARPAQAAAPAPLLPRRLPRAHPRHHRADAGRDGGGLAIPALAQFAIDHGIDAGDKGMLLLAVGLFVVAGGVGWWAGYHQTYLSSWAGERVLPDLRTDTFRHLMRLELGYHERTPTGRTVSRLTSDIEALRAAGHRRGHVAGHQRAHLHRRRGDPASPTTSSWRCARSSSSRRWRSGPPLFRVYSARATGAPASAWPTSRRRCRRPSPACA